VSIRTRSASNRCLPTPALTICSASGVRPWLRSSTTGRAAAVNQSSCTADDRLELPGRLAVTREGPAQHALLHRDRGATVTTDGATRDLRVALWAEHLRTPLTNPRLWAAMADLAYVPVSGPSAGTTPGPPSTAERVRVLRPGRRVRSTLPAHGHRRAA
jgi:hypothetical protein